jgi:hypothetical protein
MELFTLPSESRLITNASNIIKLDERPEDAPDEMFKEGENRGDFSMDILYICNPDNVRLRNSRT